MIPSNTDALLGYHRLANAQKYLGKREEAIATLRAAQSANKSAEDALSMRRSSNKVQESMPSKGSGSTVLTPAVMKELQELQPQLVSIQRELDMVQILMTVICFCVNKVLV